MATYVSAAAVEKLAALEKASKCVSTLIELRRKYSEVPQVEALELAMAIAVLEPIRAEYNRFLSELEFEDADHTINGKLLKELITRTTTNPVEPETKTKGDAAADKIIGAFEGDEYLADSDLLKASGLKRSEYIEVRDYLLYDTCELVEMEAEEDGVTVYAYAKPRKQAAA